MKALTLHQPWATAVIIGLKRFETRSWLTNHRGPLAIHASQKRTRKQRDLFEEWMEVPELRMAFEDALDLDFDCLPFGAVLGTIHLIDVEATDSTFVTPIDRHLGDFSFGRFAWRLRNASRLHCSIPCRGFQQLWSLPPEIASALSVPRSSVLSV